MSSSASTANPRAETVAGPLPIRGSLRMPGDKSLSHRALIVAALAPRYTRGSILEGVSNGDDVRCTIDCLQGLRAEVSAEDEDEMHLRVRGPRTWLPSSMEPYHLYAGNSATCMRLMVGAVAGRYGGSVRIEGDESLNGRPMGRLIEPLKLMGADIAGHETDGEQHPPLTFTYHDLKGINYTLPVPSSQVKDALLLAGLTAEGPTSVTEPLPSRTHGENLLVAAGARVEREGNTVTIWPGEVQPPYYMIIPGDLSQAAFWVVGALITHGSEITIEGVARNSYRRTYLRVLQRMGADIMEFPTGVRAEDGTEDIAALALEEEEERMDIQVRATAHLKATSLTPAEVVACIDEIPILALAAAAAEGTTTFAGVGDLRHKESDRIAEISRLLFAVGVECGYDSNSDTLRVVGNPDLLRARQTGEEEQPYLVVPVAGDHRIAMTAAIAAAAGFARMRLVGLREAVESSYPDFLNDLHDCTGWTGGLAH